jgi:hypothetical protein
MLLPATAVAMLTLGTQYGRPQAPDVKPAPPGIDQEIPLDPPVKPAAPPPPPSVESLIDQLEQLRKQKAELEAREKALIEQLQGRLKNQSDRLQKLGVAAPTVPKIAEKEDVKFLDAVVPPNPSIKGNPKAPDLVPPAPPK